MAEKIGFATLSVQQARMKVEFKQTKLLSLSTQDYSLRSQIESARQLALLACPNYNEHNVNWKRVMKLMQDQQDLMNTNPDPGKKNHKKNVVSIVLC